MRSALPIVISSVLAVGEDTDATVQSEFILAADLLLNNDYVVDTDKYKILKNRIDPVLGCPNPLIQRGDYCYEYAHSNKDKVSCPENYKLVTVLEEGEVSYECHLDPKQKICPGEIVDGNCVVSVELDPYDCEFAPAFWPGPCDGPKPPSWCDETTTEDNGSETTTEDNGSETTTEDNGSETTTEDNGSETTTEDNGSETTTEDNGSETTTEDNGSETTTEAPDRGNYNGSDAWTIGLKKHCTNPLVDNQGLPYPTHTPGSHIDKAQQAILLHEHYLDSRRQKKRETRDKALRTKVSHPSLSRHLPAKGVPVSPIQVQAILEERYKNIPPPTPVIKDGDQHSAQVHSILDMHFGPHRHLKRMIDSSGSLGKHRRIESIFREAVAEIVQETQDSLIEYFSTFDLVPGQDEEFFWNPMMVCHDGQGFYQGKQVTCLFGDMVDGERCVVSRMVQFITPGPEIVPTIIGCGASYVPCGTGEAFCCDEAPVSSLQRVCPAGFKPYKWEDSFTCAACDACETSTRSYRSPPRHMRKTETPVDSVAVTEDKSSPTNRASAFTRWVAQRIGF